MKTCPVCEGHRLLLKYRTDTPDGKRLFLVKCVECKHKGPECETPKRAKKLWDLTHSKAQITAMKEEDVKTPAEDVNIIEPMPAIAPETPDLQAIPDPKAKTEEEENEDG